MQYSQIMNNKQQLIHQLKYQGAFWSYAEKALSNMPDVVLIEEALMMGDVSELLLLFKLFPPGKVKQVWHEKLLPDKQIYPHNYCLAKVFFNIKHPDQHIKRMQNRYSRFEQIQYADT